MVKKGKRIFSRVISIILVASIMVTSNGIVTMAENVQATEQDSSVIRISSLEDLQKITEDLAGDYVLTENIDLSGEEYVPIGNNEKPFRGTFDGDGHIISNLDITVKDAEESSFAGLFGVMENATVVNLAIEDCTIKSQTAGGIYAGVVAGKMKNSLIEDVYVSGQISIEGETSYSVGGIAGAIFQSKEDETLVLERNAVRCVSNAEINVPEVANGEKGTLAGYVEDTALVEYSYSFISDVDLFGVEVSVDNSCKILSEGTWGKENSYIGFDFENIWKLTDGGVRLIGQKYEKPEEKSEDVLETETVDETESQETSSSTGDGLDLVKIVQETETSDIKSAMVDDEKESEQFSANRKESDDEIMLLASDLISG